ncbi:HHIP-like protein 1 isoform X2 [Haliotis rufescens]|uniref:HHIP-like protein 1 isoform X2 n=1 Tax=Haliotis rufescens TaxID=6454 RepID=UPI00201E830C|nr:HHIP-like protein 1 isoform X2 [Haliotis rufescens]
MLGMADRTSLLGKILRVDVVEPGFVGSSALRYGIPASNPFLDKTPWRQEVFAYGCRNMWRCSQDTVANRNENEALPIYMYMHTNLFHAVVGGYVYRGRNLLDLYGRYMYGDAMTGQMSVLTEDSYGWTSSPLPVCDGNQCPCDARMRPRDFLLTFGQDEQGEIYLLTTSSITASKDDGVALKIVSSLGKKAITCGCGDRRESTGVVVVSLMMSVLKWFRS